MPYDPPETGLNHALADLERLIDEAGPPPWRIPVVASPAVRVVLLGMTPGTGTIPHHHPRAEETFQVIRGRFGLTVGSDPEHLIGPGEIGFAMRSQVHGFRNAGPDPAVILCTVTPNEKAPDEQVDHPID